MNAVPKSPCAFCGDFQGVRQNSAFCSNECRISWLRQVLTWKLPGIPKQAPSLKPGKTIVVDGVEYVMT